METETILKSYKTEHNKYIEKLNDTSIVDLKLLDYLMVSIESHKDKSSGCIGWDYLKQNLTRDLKNILQNPEYKLINYNSENINFILNYLNVKDIKEDIKKQLGSFVYVWKDIKGDCDTQEREDNLRITLEKEGFKKISIFGRSREEALKETNEQEAERIKDFYWKYEGKKVICVLDISCIGILGSYDKKKEIEGTLSYSDYHRALMIIPKRCRTRGHIIRKDFYIKEVI